jgi:hypothetical protein
MMQKMMDKDSGCCDFDCSEMMARMTTMCCQPQDFDCSEMMARMTTMCCQPQDEKKETAEEE